MKKTTFRNLELKKKIEIIERFMALLPEGGPQWDVVVSALIKTNPELDDKLRFTNSMQLGSIGMTIGQNLKYDVK